MGENTDLCARGLAEHVLSAYKSHEQMDDAWVSKAKEWFDHGLWAEARRAAMLRHRAIDERLSACAAEIEGRGSLPWREAAEQYKTMLDGAPSPDIAWTFFRSVGRRARAPTEALGEPTMPWERDGFLDRGVIMSAPLSDSGLEGACRQALERGGWSSPVDWDSCRAAARMLESAWPDFNADSMEWFADPFYRNKGAYIVGRALGPQGSRPFALALVKKPCGQISVDAALWKPSSLGALFSMTRAPFWVNIHRARPCVEFLRELMPWKSAVDLYASVGARKQAKSEFVKMMGELCAPGTARFAAAPGIRGMVMAVFAAEGFPWVFKLVKDPAKIARSKSATADLVEEKYRLVMESDRVGRMADTMAFSGLSIPTSCFDPSYLDELLADASASIEVAGSHLILKRVYVERKLDPLNLRIASSSAESMPQLIDEYGCALRDMAAAGIFPGDMLLKNFGVNRYGRVVFYDYDEIEMLDAIHFRKLPIPQTEEQEMADEPWYPVAANDVFPEEFARFILTHPGSRAAFEARHADILTPEFWLDARKRWMQGEVVDFFPYPESERLSATADMATR